FINPANWTSIPVTERLMPQESLILKNAADIIAKEEKLSGKALEARVKQMKVQAIAQFRVSQNPDKLEQYQYKLPQTPEDKAMVGMLLDFAEKEAPAFKTEKWGILALLGLDRQLTAIDDSVRSPFTPYGLSGVMLGAAIVFFAYIGFDSISTHSEEAIRPQRDVPFRTLAPPPL